MRESSLTTASQAYLPVKAQTDFKQVSHNKYGSSVIVFMWFTHACCSVRHNASALAFRFSSYSRSFSLLNLRAFSRALSFRMQALSQCLCSHSLKNSTGSMGLASVTAAQACTSTLPTSLSTYAASSASPNLFPMILSHFEIRKVKIFPLFSSLLVFVAE